MTTLSVPQTSDVIDLSAEERRRHDWRTRPLDDDDREDRRLLRLAAAAALHHLRVREDLSPATA